MFDFIKKYVKEEKKRLSKEQVALDAEIDLMIKTKNKEQLEIIKQKNIPISFKQLNNLIINCPYLMDCIDVENTFQKNSQQIENKLGEILEEISQYHLMNIFAGSYVVKKGKKASNTEIQKVRHHFCNWIHFIDMNKSIILFSDENLKKFYQTGSNLYGISQAIGNQSLNRHKFKDSKLSIYVEKLNQVLTTFYNERFIEKIEKLTDMVVQHESHVDYLKKEENSDTFFSKEIKTLLTDLRLYFNELDKKQLSLEERLDLENIYKNRLPQLLNDYKNISHQYSTQIKDNADNILKETLENIKIKLHSMIIENQEKSLEALRVSQHYFKSKI